MFPESVEVMAEELTPMMRQYRRIKDELQEDMILLFRLGDFYEMFFEDAVRTAPVLGVTLTRRGDVPMCGVPYHALDSYLAKIIRAGLKAAICEQVEDPSQAKGIVRREVTRVVTPGTVIESEILDAARNNYIAAIFVSEKNRYSVALLDLSTGIFTAEESESETAFKESLKRSAPSECLVTEKLRDEVFLKELRCSISVADDWTFGFETAYDLLRRHFNVHSLEGFGCEGYPGAVSAAGALLYYVRETLRNKMGHVRGLQIRTGDDFLGLDESTIANLDILPVHGRNADTTLLGVLDNTVTPMGARLLRGWLSRPLSKKNLICSRHDAVESLVKKRAVLTDLRTQLGEIRDLERLIGRIEAGNGNARDVRGLGQSLLPAQGIKTVAESLENPLLKDLAAQIWPLPELTDLIEKAIAETPPPGLKDGGIIRAGWNAELDELRSLASEGHAWLAKYQASEIERTGIKTLKVRYNKVFGFYIEISKGQVSLAPDDYERRQTLVNAERFVTPQLKEYEQKIVGAQDKSTAMEYELFLEVREKIVAETEKIQQTARAFAQIDVLADFADRALALGYVRPEMCDESVLAISEGRHPVVEQLPDAERFVANDTELNDTTHQLILITGPNMAGKSTYIRQVALIVILAQIGSFVPASKAVIGVADRVFTRVGAGDDLAKGRSTFMVEMQEAANILNNATPKSLIVLDEIGRGTSTFDGISIAWSVAEYLHNTPGVKARTLFATHYHELTDLALTLKGVKNYTVQVRENGDSIVFLRRIVPGAADKSYGIHVARLAGLPIAVIERARDILSNLEENELDTGKMPKLAQKRNGGRRLQQADENQMTLF